MNVENEDKGEPNETPRKGPTREEIEQVLDKQVIAILKEAKHSEAVPGWSLIPQLGLETEYLEGDKSKPILAISYEKAELLVEMARRNPLAFDLASHIAGVRVMADLELPIPLRNFAAGVLVGECQRPKRAGRPSSKDAVIQIQQFHLCQYLSHTVPMPLTRDPNGELFTACDAVAEAFCRAGRHTTYEQMKSLCYDKGYSDRRGLTNYLGFNDFQDL